MYQSKVAELVLSSQIAALHNSSVFGTVISILLIWYLLISFTSASLDCFSVLFWRMLTCVNLFSYLCNYFQMHPIYFHIYQHRRALLLEEVLTEISIHPSIHRGGRYVLIINFYVESGQKMIQFNIQFKVEYKIFIQKIIQLNFF